MKLVKRLNFALNYVLKREKIFICFVTCYCAVCSVFSTAMAGSVRYASKIQAQHSLHHWRCVLCRIFNRALLCMVQAI